MRLCLKLSIVLGLALAFAGEASAQQYRGSGIRYQPYYRPRIIVAPYSYGYTAPLYSPYTAGLYSPYTQGLYASPYTAGYAAPYANPYTQPLVNPGVCPHCGQAIQGQQVAPQVAPQAQTAPVPEKAPPAADKPQP